jgi:23S rRNA (cytosine1962-C5)-methyltransferase
MVATVYLKPKRDKPAFNQHPWVFSGAVRAVEDDPTPGDILAVRAHDGQFIGHGYWNPASQIQVRLLSWDEQPIDDAWWRAQLKRAVDARKGYVHPAYRVIHAESDYLPGLIVDRYDRYLVMQALTLGIERRKHMIADILATLLDVDGIYERSDTDARQKDGLEISNGLIWGQEPPEHIVITEGDPAIQLAIDVYNGHKTGFYLDQTDNRAYVQTLLRQIGGQRRVLNLFSYTGGFGLHALRTGNATVINVDASFDALQLAEDAVKMNDLPIAAAEFIQADVFEYLRDMADAGELYDVVIADPPKFAHSKSQVDRASRGYKDINLNAFNVVAPGGYLMTFSCSGAISAELFQKIVFGALADSGRQAQIVRRFTAGADHPVALTFPEGDYLKGLLLRVY